jgi:hypothetical protein
MTTEATPTENRATHTLRQQGGFGAVLTVDELLDRLVETSLWDKEGDDFNPDTFEKDAAEHIKNYEISEFGVIGGPGISDASKNPIIIQNVALYMDAFFFQNRTSLKNYSVCSDANDRDCLKLAVSIVLSHNISNGRIK